MSCARHHAWKISLWFLLKVAAGHGNRHFKKAYYLNVKFTSSMMYFSYSSGYSGWDVTKATATCWSNRLCKFNELSSGKCNPALGCKSGYVGMSVLRLMMTQSVWLVCPPAILLIINSVCNKNSNAYLISNHKEKWVVWVHSCSPGHLSPFQRVVSKNNWPVQRKNHLYQTKWEEEKNHLFIL